MYFARRFLLSGFGYTLDRNGRENGRGVVVIVLFVLLLGHLSRKLLKKCPRCSVIRIQGNAGSVFLRYGGFCRDVRQSAAFPVGLAYIWTAFHI